MGTAFICFSYGDSEEIGIKKDSKTENITIEIGRIVFRTIVEAMELDKPNDKRWKGHLDGAYGIKYLYVGKREEGESYDYGPAFLTAIRYVRENGPPDYYPERDLDLLYEQLDELEKMYLIVRKDN